MLARFKLPSLLHLAACSCSCRLCTALRRLKLHHHHPPQIAFCQRASHLQPPKLHQVQISATSFTAIGNLLYSCWSPPAAARQAASSLPEDPAPTSCPAVHTYKHHAAQRESAADSLAFCTVLLCARLQCTAPTAPVHGGIGYGLTSRHSRW